MSKPSLTPNIHSASKKGAKVFWSNISHCASWAACSLPIQSFSSKRSAISLRKRTTSLRHFSLVAGRLALNILCFAILSWRSFCFISSESNKDASVRFRPRSEFAATNLASKLGNGRIPKLSAGLSFRFWSMTSEIKKRSFEIWMAIGWISTP